MFKKNPCHCPTAASDLTDNEFQQENKHKKDSSKRTKIKRTYSLAQLHFNRSCAGYGLCSLACQKDTLLVYVAYLYKKNSNCDPLEYIYLL